MIGFGTWWSVNTPVSLFQEKHTRSWVVLEMANSEGAHDDPTLDERYHELKNLQGGGYVTASGGINEFINPQPAEGNIVHASIRQITYEVLESLNRQMTLIESSARLAHLPKRN